MGAADADLAAAMLANAVLVGWLDWTIAAIAVEVIFALDCWLFFLPPVGLWVILYIPGHFEPLSEPRICRGFCLSISVIIICVRTHNVKRADGYDVMFLVSTAKKKNKAASELAAQKWKKIAPEKRSEMASDLATARWDKWTKEQRAAWGQKLAKARAAKRAKKKT